MPLEGEIKQQELNRKPFLCSQNGASLQLALSPVAALPSCFPQLGSLLLLLGACVVALSLKLFFHTPRYTYAVLPISSLTMQFAPGPLSLSPTVQTLLRPCHTRGFMTPLLWLSWLVPEGRLGNGFAFAEEKVTAPAAGGRRGHVS